MSRRERPALTAAGAGRRFVLLKLLRWVPAGLVVPVTVLLASSRGLSPAQIGLVFAVHSAVALALELPTGGLADAVGRRPVLVLSGLLHLASLVVLALARDVTGFAAAFALLGAGRALDSGPLEAWYVDAVHRLAPGTDVTPGLARGAVADGAGLALGAVLGGLLPSLVGSGASVDALVLPILLAGALDVGYLAAVLVLVVPLPPDPWPQERVSAAGAVLGGVRAVPRVVRDTVRLAALDPVLRVLLALAFLLGVTLSALELLGPLRFAELAGSAEAGTAVFGVVMAASFGAAALGAALGPAARRVAGGSVAVVSAVTCAGCAVAVAGFALAPVVVGAAVALGLHYLSSAVAWPLRDQLLHARVGAAQRATTVSARSLALMLGGVTGSLLLPLLAGATSLSAGLLAAAATMVLAAGLSLGLRSHEDVGEAPHATAPASVRRV